MKPLYYFYFKSNVGYFWLNFIPILFKILKIYQLIFGWFANEKPGSMWSVVPRSIGTSTLELLESSLSVVTMSTCTVKPLLPKKGPLFSLPIELPV
jgi:hypothetical protein